MKILRYLDSTQTVRFGARQNDGRILRLKGDMFENPQLTDTEDAPQKILAPIEATQILCIGLNYRQHAAEAGMKEPERPILFVKGVNTLHHPDDPIEIPTHLASHEVDYECELAVVIGKPCKNVSREDALDYVLGYTCANDVSARDHQIKLGGGQWCRGKFFDTFAPLGPVLVTPEDIPNPNALRISTLLNGERVQDSNTSDMIFDVPSIISYLSGSTTLVPGTVILTGTPQGVGMATKPDPRWLRPGDQVDIEIEGIGTLSNPVQLEGAAR